MSSASGIIPSNLRWTLARKIGGLVGLLLALLGVVFVLTWTALGNITDRTAQLAERDVPMLTTLAQLQVALLHQDVQVERLLARRSEPGAAQADSTMSRQIDEMGGRVRELLHKSQALVRGADHATTHVDGGERSLAAGLAEFERRNEDYERRIHDVARGGNTAPAETTSLENEGDALATSVGTTLQTIETAAGRNGQELEDVEAATLRLLAAVVGVALLVGVLVSWLIVRGIRRSTGLVTARAATIASGDLSREPLPVTSSDEIAQIAISFNAMQAALREQISQTLSAVQSLEATASEVLASVSQQAAATREQAAAIQEITATLEEIAQSGQQMAERAQQVSTSSATSRRATDAGLAAVAEGNQTIESIRLGVEEVAEHIVHLSEKTQTVGEIIAAVNDIAEQSNLLALNAAIEAASSGEQGSRFSVVANEMKNLADHAKDSTGQVRKILGEIQKGINTAVMLTEEAVKRSESGRRQSEITDKTIRELAGVMATGATAFEQIIAGTGQQRIGVDQVAQGMQDMRTAVEQTATATTQLERAVANVNSMSRQLKGSIERYRL